MAVAYGWLKDLRKLIWVLMHHPDYWQCYVRSPIVFQFYRDSFFGNGLFFRITMGIRYPSIYFPCQVDDDYLIASHRKEKHDCEYDDIPF